MKKILTLCALLTLCMTAAGWAENPRAALETSHGRVVIELYQDKAPLSVANFIKTANSGFWEGTIFHRVIKDFMIQGGGFSQDGQLKPTEVVLKNEADNGLKNLRGTVAMARKNEPDSASVQFFINDADNAFLDHKAPTPRGWGYAVFGKVVEGMDVVDAIAAVSVRRSRLSEAQPLENVTLNKVVILEAAAGSGG